MKILVTGGAGFIGSAVVRMLLSNTNYSVVNVDKLTYAGNLESLPAADLNPKYFFEQADVCDAGEIKRILECHKPNLVMHLAAESHVDRSIDDPEEFMKTNIFGTFNLLQQCNAYYQCLDMGSQERFRFHHVSTDEVFGDLGRSGDFFTEDTSYAPSSPYSASKAASDHLVRAWGRTYKLPILITNCSNNYGPFHFPEKLIPHVILSCLQGQKIPVYGDGSQIRDWLFVEDHARALIQVCTEGMVGETYNIGGHNEKSNLEVVHAICEILQDLRPSESLGLEKYSDLITFVKDRPGHDSRYAVDASKIYKDLKWLPQETFDSGLRKTIVWYLENQVWWSRVLSSEYKLERVGKNSVG